jgi:ribonuclease inhibitor
MKVIELDGRRMDSRAMAHKYLKQALGLPEYYGENLDALADCLSELTEVRIILRYPGAMQNQLGEYARGIIRVFEDAAVNRRGFMFQMKRS